MTEIKIYKSPLKSLRLILLSSIFVIPSLWFLITEENPQKIFWFSLFFFGLGFIIGFFHLFDRRPQIIINKIGIWDRTTNQDIINWEFIRNAYEMSVHNQNFISFDLDDKFIFKKKPYKWATFLNKNLGAQEVNISLGQLKINTEKLVNLINILSNEKIENREKLIEMYQGKI